MAEKSTRKRKRDVSTSAGKEATARKSSKAGKEATARKSSGTAKRGTTGGQGAAEHDHDESPVLVLPAYPSGPPSFEPNAELVTLPLFMRWSMLERAAAALGFSWRDRFKMLSANATSGAAQSCDAPEIAAGRLALARILKALVLATELNDTSWIADMERSARIFLERNHGVSAGPGAHGGDLVPTRPRVATFLRDYVVTYRDPLEDPKFEGPGLVWGILRSIRGRLESGPLPCDPFFEPITRDLPPDFDSEEREGAAARAATRVLYNSRDPQPEDIVRAILRAIGYPAEKAKSLFDPHK